MGDTRYTTAIGEALCSVASGFALHYVIKHKLSTEFPAWALKTALVCSVSGALTYGVPKLQQYRSYHQRIHFIMDCIMLPLLSLHFSLVNKYDSDLSYLQLVFPVFPLVANLVNDRHQFELRDAVVGGTLAFKTYMHFEAKNYYGLAYCMSYTISHFLIGSEGSVGDVRAKDLFVIGFIFDIFFIIKALYS